MSTDQDWHEKRENIALLARYMAKSGWCAERIAEMVSEPWGYTREFNESIEWAERQEAMFEDLRT